MRRSVRLSKTYFVLGVVISIYGTIISNILALIPANSVNPVNTPIDLMNIFPILSVAILSLSTLLFSLPVVMLFVYDKNNGVLEYLLSTGLDQLDIFKGYLKASLLLYIDNLIKGTFNNLARPPSSLFPSMTSTNSSIFSFNSEYSSSVALCVEKKVVFQW